MYIDVYIWNLNIVLCNVYWILLVIIIRFYNWYVGFICELLLVLFLWLLVELFISICCGYVNLINVKILLLGRDKLY